MTAKSPIRPVEYTMGNAMCLFDDTREHRRKPRQSYESRHYKDDRPSAARPNRYPQYAAPLSQAPQHGYSARPRSRSTGGPRKSTKSVHFEERHHSSHSRSPGQRRSAQPRSHVYHNDTRSRTTDDYSERQLTTRCYPSSEPRIGPGRNYPPAFNGPYPGAKIAVPPHAHQKPPMAQTRGEPNGHVNYNRPRMAPMVVDNRPPPGSYQPRSSVGPSRADRIVVEPQRTQRRDARRAA
jgi:hypothetical protein